MLFTRRGFLKEASAFTGSIWVGSRGATVPFCWCGRASQDTGKPSGYLLQGMVCSLNDRREIFQDGVVRISGKTIHSVAPSFDALPSEARRLTVARTNGTIYPGLLDLHKHITYDIRGPWFPNRQFKNRTEFFEDQQYKATVENPCRLLVQYADLLNEVCLYAEIKALVGGTTALQGAALYDSRYTSRLVRNIEFDNFGQDRVHQTIWDVTAESAAGLRQLMPQLDAWIYHLAEGIDEYAQKRFSDLKRLQLLNDRLVAIHCTGLNEHNLEEMARAGATLVWEPLGNLRLYGQTADVRAAKKVGLNICLGSEWAPSGSKNLLTQLKVADQFNQRVLGGLFTDREIVEMVTANPAEAVGWKGRAGQLAPGSAADILVLSKKKADPYRNLIEATEEDVQLVMIDGEPSYGDVNLMNNLNTTKTETLRPRRGKPKALSLPAAFRDCDPPSFGALTERLSRVLTLDGTALARSLNRHKVRRALTLNPPGVREEYRYFLTIGDEPLQIEEVSQFLKLVFPEGLSPFQLDPVFLADDDVFSRVAEDPALVKYRIELAPYFGSLLS